MVISLTLLAILILLTAHIFALPISKRRPVFVKGLEGTLFFFLIFALIGSLIHPFIYFIALVIAVIIYYTKLWVVYGLAIENINAALERAVAATRSSSEKTRNGYQIENSLLVNTNNLTGKLSFITYKKRAQSKKAELTIEIFRKFMQNYYI